MSEDTMPRWIYLIDHREVWDPRDMSDADGQPHDAAEVWRWIRNGEADAVTPIGTLTCYDDADLDALALVLWPHGQIRATTTEGYGIGNPIDWFERRQGPATLWLITA